MRRRPNGGGKTSRRWCFTINNPTSEETHSFITTKLAQGKGMRYCVFQLEEGEAGTPHYQGLIFGELNILNH